MLYGGYAWSETPISSLGVQAPNGDEFSFSFVIDSAATFDSTIDQVFSKDNNIDMILSFDGEIDKADQFTVTIDRSQNEALI